MKTIKSGEHLQIVEKVVEETLAWARKESGGVTVSFLKDAIYTILDYVCEMSNVTTQEVLEEYPHLFDLVIDSVKSPRNVLSKETHGISILVGETNEEIEDIEEYAVNNKQEFYFWLSLYEHLIIDKGYEKADILGKGNGDDISLDQLSDRLVMLLGLASEKKRKKKRGLLMADAQSGKTLKYTALSAKALDLSRKIVIIIAGATSIVRGQTQERLEYGVIGLTADRKLKEQMRKTGGSITPIGAGQYFRDKRPFVKPITTMDDGKKNGDLTPENLSKSYENSKDPLVFVVKSTKQNLEALLEFLQTNIVDSCGNPCAETLPALIIHDECDYSSLNLNGTKHTSARKKGEDGPSTCNRLIRELVGFFDCCSYLAVSATPFANVLINPFCSTVEKFKKDLFPEDFILYVKPKKKYISPYDYFGLPLEGGEEEPLPLTVITNDIDQFNEESITSKDFYKNRNFPIDGRPESLEQAIDQFLFSGGLRLCRETDRELLQELGLTDWTDPHSMLIHISESITQQQDIHQSVIEYVDIQKEDIKNGMQAFYNRCKTMWKNAKLKTKKIQEMEVRKRGTANPRYKVDYPFHQVWHNIVTFLDDFYTKEVVDPLTGEVIHEANIRILNSGSEETLNYQKYRNTNGKPLKVIVIGANIIARGVSLEGLCVTYYTRDSVIYDTTIQSGRFFGYYDDWKDQISVYLSKHSYDIFEKATITIRSLIQQIQEMNKQGKTPMEFGIRMEKKSKPSYKGEKITNKVKSEHAYLYSRNLLDIGKEIAAFYMDDRILEQNFIQIQSALTKMVDNPSQRVYEDQFQAWIQGVPQNDILVLLQGLRICGHSRLKSIPTILKIIEEQADSFDVIIPKLLKNENGTDNAGVFTFGTGASEFKTNMSIRKKLDIEQDNIGTYFQPKGGRILTTRHLTYGLEPAILAQLKERSEFEQGKEPNFNKLLDYYTEQMEIGTLKHDMIYREAEVLSKREKGVIYFYPLAVKPINDQLEGLGFRERISVTPIGVYVAFPGQAESRNKDRLYLGNTIDRLMNYYGENVIGGKKLC